MRKAKKPGIGHAVWAVPSFCLRLLLNARFVGIAMIGLSLFAIWNAEPPREISYQEERKRMETLRTLTQCYADHHGVILRDVYFREWTMQAPCVRYEYKLLCLTPGEMVNALGWAMPHGQTVNYWSVSLREEHAPESFEYLAAHETCHVTGIWDEQQTDRCAHRTVASANCGE